MQQNGAPTIIYDDGDILADPKEPSSHIPKVALPKKVVVETVILNQSSS